MCNKTEGQHEQEERGCTVFQILINFPRYTAKPQKTKYFKKAE